MDLILYNGAIKTMDSRQNEVQAVAITDGWIAAIGSDEEILALKTADTEMIDLQGRCAVPGFNDSHLHLLSYAEDLFQVDLSGAGSIVEVQRLLKEFIEEHQIKAGQWIQGHGWNQDYFAEKRYPTRYDLDAVSQEHPILINRACRHMYGVNSLALELSGITKETAEVPGGEILRDEKGEPLGLLTENARSLLKAVDKEADVAQLKELIQLAQKKLLANGITSIHSDDFSFGSEKVMEAYTSLAKAGALHVRVNQQCRPLALTDLQEILSCPQTAEHIQPYYRLGAVKALADGSLGARTALMKEDYYDMPGTKGIAMYSQEEMDDIVGKSHEAGRPVLIHAIGDGAVEMVLNSIEKAQRQYPEKKVRHGVNHCQITDEALLKRFQELAAMAFVQPIFLHYDLHIVESRVGKAKAATSYNFKSFLDLGVPMAFGTDCPIEPFNPLHNIYCAVTRRDLKGLPVEGYYPEQCVSVEEAVYCYTAGSAYGSGEEAVKGTLTPGKFGDIAVLSDNIFTITPDAIKDVTVDMTISGGKIRYAQ